MPSRPPTIPSLVIGLHLDVIRPNDLYQISSQLYTLYYTQHIVVRVQFIWQV